MSWDRGESRECDPPRLCPNVSPGVLVCEFKSNLVFSTRVGDCLWVRSYSWGDPNSGLGQYSKQARGWCTKQIASSGRPVVESIRRRTGGGYWMSLLGAFWRRRYRQHFEVVYLSHQTGTQAPRFCCVISLTSELLHFMFYHRHSSIRMTPGSVDDNSA